MKKILTFAMTALVCMSCAAKKPVQQASRSTNPFGDTFEAPCTVYDTPDRFAATGIFRGSSHQLGEVQKGALLNAQELVRLKMQHAYKGMVSEYSSNIGDNNGNDIERKMTSAGDHMIDAIVNETAQSCTKYGAVEEDGHITCYTAIEISKAETAKKVASAVQNMLSDDEKMRINFNEEQYRQQMEKRFEEFKDK